MGSEVPWLIAAIDSPDAELLLDGFSQVVLDTFVRATLSASASARSLVRSFSASLSAARSDRALPGSAIGTLSVRTIRSPVLGSSPTDTRSCTRSRIRRMLPRIRGFAGSSTAAMVRTLALVIHDAVS